MEAVKSDRITVAIATSIARAVVDIEEQKRKTDGPTDQLCQMLPEETRVQMQEVVSCDIDGLPHTVFLVYPEGGQGPIRWLRRIWLNFATSEIVEDTVDSDETWAPTSEKGLRSRHCMNVCTSKYCLRYIRRLLTHVALSYSGGTRWIERHFHRAV